jgi:hypothetical protein
MSAELDLDAVLAFTIKLAQEVRPRHVLARSY